MRTVRPILVDGLGDARSLHLHGDEITVGQFGKMHLRQRSRSGRLFLERLERISEVHPQLCSNDSLDIVVRKGRHLVLQHSERANVFLREQIGSRAQDLPNFDESRTELEQ